MKSDPAEEQEQVAKYYHEAQIGRPAAFRQTHYGLVEDVVTERPPRP
jgi:hypothetical protein